ncbi:hypothetical protein OSB04_un001261 [Centaurea solstitialis]|uniref:Integrase catalytic domain-containing protein n=1 Tax=Centaurea solstitialis TaxID=347529 RepID=A0AA38SM36_9ASTR|nr:hypothetical protein OSB04_un001261 [Centaurea solstitialis]
MLMCLKSNLEREEEKKRKGETFLVSAVPKPKEKSEKETASTNSTVSDPKEPIWQWYGSDVNDEDNNAILSARRNGNLYTTVFRSIPQTHPLFEANPKNAICLLTKASKGDSWLWHRRLCHQNFKDMNKLGLPELRLSKDTFVLRANMDLCGPMRVESLARKKYMLTNSLGSLGLNFFETNQKLLKRIIAFIKRTQVLLGRRVRKIRSDNGTEFRNAKLQSFLEEVGITHNFSAVRTPQQNGS